eukprot:417506-Amphidinium_carterae.1
MSAVSVVACSFVTSSEALERFTDLFELPVCTRNKVSHDVITNSSLSKYKCARGVEDRVLEADLYPMLANTACC